MSGQAEGVKAVVLERLAHHSEEGKPAGFAERLFWMGSDLVPGAELFITTRRVEGVERATENDDSVTAMHTHVSAQVYLLVGDEGALKAEAVVEGREIAVTSPSSVYIPAGARHRIRVVEGTGLIMAILCSGEYA